MRSLLIMLFLVVPLLAGCGPRMRDQQSLKPYKSPVPAMPQGVVPVGGREAAVFTREAKRPANPLAVTDEGLARGKVHYVSYCLMCHGDDGSGNGPVGEGYVPKPSDLRAARVRSLTDGALYRASLTGRGHDPVMRTTVPPEARWELVMYVRTFAGRR